MAFMLPRTASAMKTAASAGGLRLPVADRTYTAQDILNMSTKDAVKLLAPEHLDKVGPEAANKPARETFAGLGTFEKMGARMFLGSALAKYGITTDEFFKAASEPARPPEKPKAPGVPLPPSPAQPAPAASAAKPNAPLPAPAPAATAAAKVPTPVVPAPAPAPAPTPVPVPPAPVPAAGGKVASLPPQSAAAPSKGDPRGMANYIRERAAAYGINPEVALRVARSEGLGTFQSSVPKTGKGGYNGREDSWGAFQLYMGGGLGNQFQKETGLDPRDPKNEKAGIDFALKHAAKNGWGAFHGAANTGIGAWDGIGKDAAAKASQTQVLQHTGGSSTGMDPEALTPSMHVGRNTPDELTPAFGPYTVPEPEPPATAVAAAAPTPAAAEAPAAGKGFGEGLGDAFSGLGSALGKSAGAGTGSVGSTLIPMAQLTPPGAPVPTVDPKLLESQKQQLALAMQRLNSGKLF